MAASSGPRYGHESEQPRQHAPERCGRDADQPQAHPDHHAEAGIHRQLGYEVSAEPLAGIVHGHRRPVQVGGTKETYEPVAQVLALHQNENRNYEHDDRGLEWSNYRLNH